MPLKDVANVMLAKLASIIVVKTGFMLVSILPGCFAEYVITSEDILFKVPDTIQTRKRLFWNL